MSNLIVGYGYLAKHLVNSNIINGVIYNKNLELKEYDDIYYFGTPISVKSFKDIYKMINACFLLFKLRNKCKRIIYAGSIAQICEKSLYSFFKNIHLSIIKKFYKDYKCCYIGRIYSSDRQKGLIEKLRNGKFKGSRNKNIAFQDINDFIVQYSIFINSEHKTNIFNYNVKLRSINDIYNIYVNSEHKTNIFNYNVKLRSINDIYNIW